MKFKDFIQAHSWLSIEMTLLNLYPDQKNNLEAYKAIFESLQIMEAEYDEMLIVLLNMSATMTRKMKFAPLM